jgi:transcriptional regulator of acetoin/glycerol metabolism
MSNGYREGLTLDRKDSNGNYSPDNCRWVDRFVQNSNTSRNVYYTYNGKTMTISQWSRELGIARNTLRLRSRNHGYEKALSIKGNMRGRKIS